MKNYKLVFEENFDYQGKVNPDIWNYEVGEKWPNNESQCYIDDLDHCFVKDSKLHIIATKGGKTPCNYQSSKINTYGNQHFQYGKFIVRAKMPEGNGSWPAIWFLGTNVKTHQVRWPLCGEIDLLEFSGNRPLIFSSAIHTKAYNHKINTQIGKRVSLPTVSSEFHDYELLWTPENLVFSVDGNTYLTIDKKSTDTEEQWPFDQPYYLLINLAVGGWYGGSIDDSTFPFELQVDSIKYYQEK